MSKVPSHEIFGSQITVCCIRRSPISPFSEKQSLRPRKLFSALTLASIPPRSLIPIGSSRESPNLCCLKDNCIHLTLRWYGAIKPPRSPLPGLRTFFFLRCRLLISSLFFKRFRLSSLAQTVFFKGFGQGALFSSFNHFPFSPVSFLVFLISPDCLCCSSAPTFVDGKHDGQSPPPGHFVTPFDSFSDNPATLRSILFPSLFHIAEFFFPSFYSR